MQISGCGYICSECVLKENGICSSCSMENEIADVCPIMILQWTEALSVKD